MLARFTSPQAYTPRHLAEKILTSCSTLEGGRKQVTVFFCDLANSTAMAARCGPDNMYALLKRFFELAHTHLDRAALSHTQGDTEAAAAHLSTAYAWFVRLQVPRYVERAEQLARVYSLTLTEVPLADLHAARRSMIEALLAEGYPVPEPAVVSSVVE
jgi:class 3 adenylate cyclase